MSSLFRFCSNPNFPPASRWKKLASKVGLEKHQKAEHELFWIDPRISEFYKGHVEGLYAPDPSHDRDRYMLVMRGDTNTFGSFPKHHQFDVSVAEDIRRSQQSITRQVREEYFQYG